MWWTIGIALVVFAVVCAAFASPTQCSICGNPLKKTRYRWKINGRAHHACPHCNRRLEQAQSTAAFHGTPPNVPIPPRPPARRIRVGPWIVAGLIACGVLMLFKFANEQKANMARQNVPLPVPKAPPPTLSETPQPSIDQPELSAGPDAGVRGAGYEIAKKIVSGALLSPSNAEWPWETVRFQHLDPIEATPAWTVLGEVHATNAFGVKVRHDWEITLSKLEGTFFPINAKLDGTLIYGQEIAAIRSTPKQPESLTNVEPADVASPAPAAEVPDENFREWTIGEQEPIEAEFLRYGAGRATLRARDGKLITVPAADLSESDRDALRAEFRKRGQSPPF